MPDIYPVSPDRHASKQFVANKSWSFTAGQGLAPLLCSEFALAAHSFPIVFGAKGADSDQFGVFAMLGLQPDTNLLVNDRGQWLTKYIPAVFRRYPFLMVKPDIDKDQFMLCVDEADGHLVDKGGEPLFTEQGEKTPFLDRTFNFVRDCQQQVPQADRLCALLHRADLLSPLNVEIREEQSKQVVKMSGLLRVDEEKLTKLSDEEFLALRKQGALPLIYAHLFSLRMIDLLAELQRRFSKNTNTAGDALPDSFSF